MSSRTVARSKRVQYAALPFRPAGASGTEVMLVTSRGRQRWIIPKGWPHSGRAPCDSAAREAFEEAGVLGAIGRRSVGSFRYKKRLKKGRVAVCDVHVFPLNVARQRRQWPEKNQRDIKWVSVREAAATVKNGRLREIIRRWAQMTAAQKRRAPVAAATKAPPQHSRPVRRAQRRRWFVGRRQMPEPAATLSFLDASGRGSP
jgi:8-oxo-dGTP pyrophosphatase MutT (NUDIX family)